MLSSAFRFVSRRSFSSAAVPEALWKLGRLNHVAIATPDLAKSAAMYKNILGAEVSEPQALPEHGVTTIFINLGNTKLELLHPLGEKSPIQVQFAEYDERDFYNGSALTMACCHLFRVSWTKTNPVVCTISASKWMIFRRR